MAYVVYISAVDFPPDWVRAAPLIWLLGAAFGLERGARSFYARRRIAPLAAVAAGFLNLVFAGVFGLAAMMGD